MEHDELRAPELVTKWFVIVLHSNDKVQIRKRDSAEPLQSVMLHGPIVGFPKDFEDPD